MYNLQKIQGHIKMLNLQKVKIENYLEEEKKMSVPNPERIKDITRALKRIDSGMIMWNKRLEAFTNAPPRPVSRPAITDQPGNPLIS